MATWIYNRNGFATALDCGDSVYNNKGILRLWISDNNLYNRNGQHVGGMKMGYSMIGTIVS